MQTALDETHEYLDKIELKGSSDANWERMLALVHALDHLQRLHERCEEDEDRAITARETADLSSIKHGLVSAIVDVQDKIMRADWVDIAVRSRKVELDIGEQVDPMRDIIASSIASGRLDIPDATDCLEAIRWLDRVSHHVNRIALHIQQAVMASGK
jgi:phosphate:Na+ symporter